MRMSWNYSRDKRGEGKCPALTSMEMEAACVEVTARRAFSFLRSLGLHVREFETRVDVFWMVQFFFSVELFLKFDFYFVTFFNTIYSFVFLVATI